MSTTLVPSTANNHMDQSTHHNLIAHMGIKNSMANMAVAIPKVT